MVSVLKQLTTFVVVLSIVRAQSPNLTVIEIYPCDDATTDKVSRFKTDVYVVKSSLEHCQNIPGDQNSNITGVRVNSRIESINKSVVFVTRSNNEVSSWTIPFQPQGFTEQFYAVSRTVCPVKSSNLNKGEDSGFLYIDVFTSSLEDVFYEIQVDVAQNFVLRVDNTFSVMVGAATPQIFYFKFSDNINKVAIEAESESKKCAIISVQKNDCPINDLVKNAQSKGRYQTMSKSAYMVVSQENEVMNEEFVVVVITTNYSTCYKQPPDGIINGSEYTQNITITLHDMSKLKYNLGLVFFIPIFFSMLHLVVVLFYWLCFPHCSYSVCSKKCNRWCTLKELKCTLWCTLKKLFTQCFNRSDSGEKLSVNQDSSAKGSNKNPVDGSSAGQEKTQYMIYFWNTFTIGIFYGLPAIQLIYSTQEMMKSSGNDDICYYNFKCAHPFGVTLAFNNIWSNSMYMILGLLFILIVCCRHYCNRRKNDNTKGIPQFYGIYYGMGTAIFLEGVMSSFYHVCPTNANYQFDTAFMFIIGGLFIVKLMQKRHPNINAVAFITFFIFAFIVLMTLIGLYQDQINSTRVRLGIFIPLTVIFMAFLIVFFFYSSLFDNVAEVSFDEAKRIFMETQTPCPGDKCPLVFKVCPFTINHAKRIYKEEQKRCKYPLICKIATRLIVPGILNSCLLGVAIKIDFLDFATKMLIFFIANFATFLAVYLIHKPFIGKEPISDIPIVLFILVILMWLAALFLFEKFPTSNWQDTPAQSRVKNQDCIFLDFFDHHDAWHFLSASALFFTSLFLLVLDDDVKDKERKDIKVF